MSSKYNLSHDKFTIILVFRLFKLNISNTINKTVVFPIIQMQTFGLFDQLKKI